jgi:hypothetical protein
VRNRDSHIDRPCIASVLTKVFSVTLDKVQRLVKHIRKQADDSGVEEMVN